MKLSSNALGSFLAVSACSAQPVMAQIQGPPSLVETGKVFSLEDEKQPLLSLTQSLDKKGSKNLKFEFGRYTTGPDTEKSSLRLQVGPGMEMKAKFKRVKFTWEF